MVADGHAINNDDTHWSVNCPNCEKRFEYGGFFDAQEKTMCSCGAEFTTRRIYFDDGSFIE